MAEREDNTHLKSTTKTNHLVALFVAVILSATAHATDRTLTVYPIAGNTAESVARGGLIVGLAMAHGMRFEYVGSSGLSVTDVKPQYKKKDLEKLEKDGVRVTVTSAPEVRVRVGGLHQ